MAGKQNKAFVKIGCGLTPVTAPNCAFYKQGEPYEASTRGDIKGSFFCAYFNRYTLLCTSKIAACHAMVLRMKDFGYYVKADDKQIKED